MKNMLFITTLCVAFTLVAHAQNTSDQEQIKKTVSYYLEGGTHNNFETLKKAFHENATMKFISKEGYKEVNALDFFKKAIQPGLKQNRTTRIIAIDVTGTAATAKIKIDYATASFIDYMNLLKIDGTWKIVGKIFSRQQNR